MALVQFTKDDEKIIDEHPVKSSFLDGMFISITSKANAQVTLPIYGAVLSYFASSQPAQKIKLADSSKTLAERLGYLANACFRQIERPNGSSTDEFLTTLKPHFDSLVESKSSNIGMWTAAAGLLIDFNSPTAPQTPTSTTPTSAIPPKEYDNTANQSVLNTLHDKWTGDYLPESLSALRDEIRRNEQRIADGLKIYAKTLLLVQSTGMGKSRLADKFGETCPMINFTLGQEDYKCYPPVDEEVRSFLCEDMPEQVKTKVLDTPRKKGLSSKRFLGQSESKVSALKLPKPEKMTTERLSLNRDTSSLLEEDKRARSFERRTRQYHENLATTLWNHTRAAAFLQACFDVANKWVGCQNTETTLETLAKIRHESMAPYDHGSKGMDKWSRRSDDRTLFCEGIAYRAAEIAERLIESREWRHAFHDDGDSQVRRALETNSGLTELKEEAKKLTDNFRKFPRDKSDESDPLLVVVFDEAAGLLKLCGPGKLDTGLYHALHRIISCLKDLPIWFFFLSTESQLRMLLPANSIERTDDFASDPSSRVGEEGESILERFPPFLAFQLDVENRRKMRDADSRKVELAMCLDEFAALEHMAKFGRPLWHEYKPTEMKKLAEMKLVGGKRSTDGQRKRAPYDPMDVNHVFAALSFRLFLDPCLQTPAALPLVRTAVNSFMRVVISMDHEIGVMHTITPSEPVVAKAAMGLLCANDKNWSNSIQTLATGLLEKALVEKGLKGELYARFLLILARDRIYKVQGETPTFTVDQFLKSLYAKHHHTRIQLISNKLLDAKMNFNHIIPTSKSLTPDVLPTLLHDLLRRSAGMQLAFGQPLYDIMIPIYFGDSAKAFDESECGVILIQVKNKVKVTTPQKVLGGTFSEVTLDSKSRPKRQQVQQTANFNNEETNSDHKETDSNYKEADEKTTGLEKLKGPVLFLLFDLGTAPMDSVDVARNNGIGPIWSIHSRGNDKAIFGCLERMNCALSSQIFFASIKPQDSIHNTICQRNEIFSELDWDLRYPSPGPGPAPDPGKRKRTGGSPGPTSRLRKKKRTGEASGFAST